MISARTEGLAKSFLLQNEKFLLQVFEQNKIQPKLQWKKKSLKPMAASARLPTTPCNLHINISKTQRNQNLY